MHLVDEHNADAYLRERGWVDAAERVAIRPLSGGVSNQVLYVARPDRPGHDFVLKQARPRLRVPEAWFSSVERVWREVDVLRVCADLLDRDPNKSATSDDANRQPPLRVGVPRVLFEDRANYAFAMTAAPADHRVWRAELLAGRIDPEVAAACGRLLGRLHAGSWGDAALAQRLGDRGIFEELRLDPYYAHVARGAPAWAGRLDRLIESVRAHPRSLVLADFSPKNMLIHAGGLTLVDFETGHFGDPAFDIGFFLSHLVLKTAYHAADAARRAACLELMDRFWREYRSALLPACGAAEYEALVGRGVQNVAGCVWARLDGKSRVDYLSDPAARDALRGMCQRVLADPQASWQMVVDGLAR